MSNQLGLPSIVCVMLATLVYIAVSGRAQSQDIGFRKDEITHESKYPATNANFLRLQHARRQKTYEPSLVDAMWNFSVRRPVYKVLPRPDYDGQTTPASPKPITLGRPSQPYAYGWFGVQPSPKPKPAFNLKRRYNRIIFQ